MTPKEKAKELCLKFQQKLFINLSDKEEDADYIHNDSKECALVVVDEIIKEKEAYGQGTVYWHNVKREIEIL
jgi:hypothetical protein